jgi:SAM-dependent methyltransferase
MDWLADLPDFKARRALDVATGSGRFARMLAARGIEVVGVDVDVDRAEPCPGVRFEAMDAERLAFEDASFDLVTMAWGLHHMANPTRVLLEMRRVLKPGGTLLLVEPIRVWTGTNRDHHLSAHLMLAAADFAAGKPHFPIFEQLQVGSVIQGLGLVDLGFEAMMGLPEEETWDLAQCQAAGEPWVAKLEALGTDEARELAGKIRAEGLRTSPMHRVFGRVPG